MRLSKRSRTPSARRRRVIIAAGLATIVLLLALTSNMRATMIRLSDQVFDSYQRISPRHSSDPAVAVVDIDEGSIAKLGQWPWSRQRMAELVDHIGAAGAAVIAFDIAFSEPDRSSLGQAVGELRALGANVSLPDAGVELDYDAAFAAAIGRNPVVLGLALSNETPSLLPPAIAGFSYAGSDPSAYLPRFSGGIGNLDILTAQATGLGSFSFLPSADNIIRTMPLVSTTEGGLFAALNIEALRVALGASNFIIRSSDASGEIAGGKAQMTALKLGNFEVPTGPQGEFWLHYSGMPDMAVVAAADLFDPVQQGRIAAQLEGRIVLVGTSAIGLRDIVATPVSPAMPGVRVHAEVIDQILNQSFLTRPDWAKGAEITLAVLGGLVLTMIVAYFGPVISSFGLVALVGGCWLLSWIAFTQSGILLSPVLPILCLVAVFGLTAPLLILMGNREKMFVRNAFGRYLSPALVSRLSDDPSALKLGGENRELTILFSDIRGFTSLSENLDPTQLTALLNGFLTPMTDVLLEHEATIDKYIGDAIMAFWNAPLTIADHPRKACLAALGMVKAVEQLNLERGTDIRIGIGLHMGPACVGNLGSSQRFSYSAIGDSVNLASRVEGLTKQYGVTIALTDEVYQGASDLACLEIDRVRVVGRNAPVVLYALTGDGDQARSPEFVQFAAQHQRFLHGYRAQEFEFCLEFIKDFNEVYDREFSAIYALYQQRIAKLMTQPPGKDWDGIYVATSK